MSALCGSAKPRTRRTVSRASFWSATLRSVRMWRQTGPMPVRIDMVPPPSLSAGAAVVAQQCGQLAEPPHLRLALVLSLLLEVQHGRALQQCLGLGHRAVQRSGQGRDQVGHRVVESSSRGTTAVASPIARASSALTHRVVAQISRALE